MAGSFVQVPPQSTGKKVATEALSDIRFQSLTGSFAIGDVITGQLSGASGTVSAVVSEGYAINEGELILKSVSGSFQNNENLLVDAVAQAVTNIPGSDPQIDADYQKIILSDPDNPRNMQKIDRFGATLNSFTDGSPLFGPFGTLSVGQPSNIRTYSFRYSDTSRLFSDNTFNSATLVYDSNASSVVFSTPTIADSAVTRTSNFYHPYIPGVGSDVEMSIAIGDVGKANVVRRWGYFNEEDGMYWELNQTTLNVVIRSSTTGVVTETRVPQSQFSADKLDGSDSIAFNIDVSKGNIYWIDFQWLGVGRVRFGVVSPSGEKIVAHIFENANVNTISPYISTATLPIRFEQYNIGASASTSEMRLICCGIRHTTQTEIDRVRFTGGTGSDHVTISDASGEIPIMSIQVANTVGDKIFRGHIRPEDLDVVNIGDANLLIRTYRGDTSIINLTGPSFTPTAANISGAEIDTTATAVAFGAPGLSRLHTESVKPNDSKHMTFKRTSQHELEIYNNHDYLSANSLWTITAEVIGTGTSNVVCNLNWSETIV